MFLHTQAGELYRRGLGMLGLNRTVVRTRLENTKGSTSSKSFTVYRLVEASAVSSTGTVELTV